jgi:hypothetical protein
MDVDFYGSPDGRILTGEYRKGGVQRFCLSEKTAGGVLITEFNINSEVVNQVYVEGKDNCAELSRYIGVCDCRPVKAGGYRGIVINARCSACGSVGLRRSLDAVRPSEIRSVPVIPLFACGQCGKSHYSLTDEYLALLVQSKSSLFDKEELEQIDGDREASVRLLQEYIIRIFASKKISRVKIE